MSSVVGLFNEKRVCCEDEVMHMSHASPKDSGGLLGMLEDIRLVTESHEVTFCRVPQVWYPNRAKGTPDE
jgi:hypothetical protein